MTSIHSLILLSFITALVSCNGTKQSIKINHEPKDMCKFVLYKFSQSVSDFTNCTSSFARPIQLCLRCRDEYIAVGRAYDYMETFTQDDVSCKQVLTQQDRLGVIEQMYKFANSSESIWHLASCNNCYENNDPTTNRKANTTTEFEKRWNQTMTCFKGFLKPDDLSPEMTLADLVTEHDIKDKILCQNCSEVYNSLRNFFWEKVVPSNPEGILSGVCYDIRDRFNLTGQIWKETFDCEPMPESWKFLLPGIFFTIFIITMTYVCEPKILPYFFPSKIEETVALVQQDIYDGEIVEANEDFVHGNFEVVPGVSADEYIQRFQTVQISFPNGNKSSIRIPPPPEDFYDLEWHNDEWILPPKDLILKMNEVKQQFKQNEISENEMDILQCKLILEELNRNKLQRRRPSEISLQNIPQQNEVTSIASIQEEAEQ